MTAPPVIAKSQHQPENKPENELTVQQQCDSARRALRDAGRAAHALNQPLTAILGYAEMLKRRLPETDGTRKAVTVICREVERMAALVHNLGEITGACGPTEDVFNALTAPKDES